jgi:hypothetical protein
MDTKMKSQRWHDLPRQGRLARVLWPQLMEKQFQDEVAAMSRNEGKTGPLAARGKEQRHQSWWETGKRSK